MKIKMHHQKELISRNHNSPIWTWYNIFTSDDGSFSSPGSVFGSVLTSLPPHSVLTVLEVVEVVDEAPAVDGEDEGLDDDKAEKLLKFFFTLVTQASIGRRRFFSSPWTTDFTVGRCTS